MGAAHFAAHSADPATEPALWCDAMIPGVLVFLAAVVLVYGNTVQTKEIVFASFVQSEHPRLVPLAFESTRVIWVN